MYIFYELIIKSKIFLIILLFLILNILLKSNLKVCVCTIGKNENKYAKEFVEYYKKYGIDKIFLYDNNDNNGEKFDEVLYEYIRTGFVEIINFRGKIAAQLKEYKDCYKKNYKNYNWLIFFDMDEFLYLKNYNNIKKFLSISNYK